MALCCFELELHTDHRQGPSPGRSEGAPHFFFHFHFFLFPSHPKASDDDDAYDAHDGDDGCLVERKEGESGGS